MDEILYLYETLLEYGHSDDPELQEKAQKLFYKGHRLSKKFADARDGFDRQGSMYTKDEKYDLVSHAFDYLLNSEYPNFEEISEHMKRTPNALQQQLQKLFIQCNWSWRNLVDDYGITRKEAELLIAPQHKSILNK
jgi:hypothetical protein